MKYDEAIQMIEAANPRATQMFRSLMSGLEDGNVFDSEIVKRGNNFLIIAHDQRDGSRWEIKPLRKAH